MVVAEEGIVEAVSLFPVEIASQISFWVQAIGGVFAVYLIVLIIRTIMMYRMSKDIQEIKKKLGIRSKKKKR